MNEERWRPASEVAVGDVVWALVAGSDATMVVKGEVEVVNGYSCVIASISKAYVFDWWLPLEALPELPEEQVDATYI